MLWLFTTESWRWQGIAWEMGPLCLCHDLWQISYHEFMEWYTQFDVYVCTCYNCSCKWKGLYIVISSMSFHVYTINMYIIYVQKGQTTYMYMYTWTLTVGTTCTCQCNHIHVHIYLYVYMHMYMYIMATASPLLLAQDVVAQFSLRRDLITCRPPHSHRPFRKSNNRGRFSENLIFRQTVITRLRTTSWDFCLVSLDIATVTS